MKAPGSSSPPGPVHPPVPDQHTTAVPFTSSSSSSSSPSSFVPVHRATRGCIGPAHEIPVGQPSFYSCLPDLCREESEESSDSCVSDSEVLTLSLCSAEFSSSGCRLADTGPDSRAENSVSLSPKALCQGGVCLHGKLMNSPAHWSGSESTESECSIPTVRVRVIETERNATTRNSASRQHSKPKALDLFSGKGSVRECLEKRGYEVISVDIDPRFSPTFTCDIMLWN